MNTMHIYYVVVAHADDRYEAHPYHADDASHAVSQELNADPDADVRGVVYFDPDTFDDDRGWTAIRHPDSTMPGGLFATRFADRRKAVLSLLG